MSHQHGPQRHYDKKCFASVVANCADVSSHPAQRGAGKELFFFSHKNNAVTDINKTEGAVCSKKGEKSKYRSVCLPARVELYQLWIQSPGSLGCQGEGVTQSLIP